MQRMLLPIAVCGTILLSLPLRGDDWPQWRGPQRDGVWRETGIVSALPDKLPIRWRAPIGPGYCGPSVADGRVFCMDKINAPNSQERIVCLDAANGNLLWEYAYDCRYTISYTAGPRATVTVEDGQVYALGAQGHLHCLDAEKGTVLWQRDLAGDFQLDDRMPIWGIAGAPLIADDLLVVQLGAPQACIVALHKRDGSNAWQALDDRACYAAPLLIEQAGQTVLVCWTGDSISALDPATGSLHWRFAFPPTRMPIGIATPLVKDHQLFVTSFYDGSLMLKLAADQLKSDLDWQKRGPDEQNTEALHSIISTPIWLGDHIYGVDSYGELRCLEASTGRRVWEDQTATPKARWSTIHFVQHGENVWMFNERGELILGKLSPDGFQEISRAKLLEPTTDQLRQRGGVCWSHPAFANRCVFVRNDRELVCASLAAE